MASGRSTSAPITTTISASRRSTARRLRTGTSQRKRISRKCCNGVERVPSPSENRKKTRRRDVEERSQNVIQQLSAVKYVLSYCCCSLHTFGRMIGLGHVSFLVFIIGIELRMFLVISEDLSIEY